MGKCIYCHKKLSLFGKDKICDDCKDTINELVHELNSNMEDLNNKIDLNKMSLGYNIDIYINMLSLCNKVDEIKKIIPNISAPSTDDVKKQIYANIEKYCDKKYEKFKNSPDFKEELNKLINELASIDIKLENNGIYIFHIISKYTDIRDNLRPLTDFTFLHDNDGTYVYYEGEKVYLLEGEKLREQNDNVSQINDVLKTCYQYIPHVEIKNIIGIPKINTPSRNFSMYLTNILTPSGRPAKYPSKLMFMTNEKHNNINDIFGDIYYLKNGQIGKAEVIIWHDKKLYDVYIILSNDELIVSKIYGMNDNYENIILYKL